ncbi:hypothetical protein AB4305_20275 [Nocardia sp. 2YAB30]|uniref:hypothetical protein n=1 Tax=unclassified Nocardia TaxID=2637762 RepID=UPI003F981009
MTIENLERALPGLAQYRRDAPEVPDWQVVENALGFRFPSDYKEIAESYPLFVLCDDFMSIVRPRPGRELAFVEGVRDELRILQDNYDDGVAEYPPHPQPGGLLPWGASTSGDTYYWAVADGTAAAVITGSRSDIYWRFDGDITDYLAAWLSGDVTPDGQPTAAQLGGPDFTILE